jgi:hypothetical protein
MMETTLECRNPCLLKGGGEDDEGIPTSLPSSVDDIAGRVDVRAFCHIRTYPTGA